MVNQSKIFFLFIFQILNLFLQNLFLSFVQFDGYYILSCYFGQLFYFLFQFLRVSFRFLDFLIFHDLFPPDLFLPEVSRNRARKFKFSHRNSLDFRSGSFYFVLTDRILGFSLEIWFNIRVHWRVKMVALSHFLLFIVVFWKIIGP